MFDTNTECVFIVVGKLLIKVEHLELPRVGMAGGGSLSLALAGSSGPHRHGVQLAGGGSLSVALAGSSGPPRRARVFASHLAALSSRFRLARERVILSAPEELPTSVTVLSTKFDMAKS